MGRSQKPPRGQRQETHPGPPEPGPTSTVTLIHIGVSRGLHLLPSHPRQPPEQVCRVQGVQALMHPHLCPWCLPSPGFWGCLRAPPAPPPAEAERAPVKTPSWDVFFPRRENVELPCRRRNTSSDKRCYLSCIQTTRGRSFHASVTQRRPSRRLCTWVPSSVLIVLVSELGMMCVWFPSLYGRA